MSDRDDERGSEPMEGQQSLLDDLPRSERPEARPGAEHLSFGGETFEPEHDEARLTGQLRATFMLMRDGHWRTGHELETALGHPWASISARLRDFRKPQFGGHTVERRRVRQRRGTFEYRLLVRQ